jgi:hypothetical protein
MTADILTKPLPTGSDHGTHVQLADVYDSVTVLSYFYSLLSIANYVAISICVLISPYV